MKLFALRGHGIVGDGEKVWACTLASGETGSHSPLVLILSLAVRPPTRRHLVVILSCEWQHDTQLTPRILPA